MLIRNILAVIDYNSNINRPQKVSKDGQGLFKKKVLFEWKSLMSHCWSQVDRTGTKATVVEQKVDKDRRYQENIWDLCVQCLDTGVVLTPEVITMKFQDYLYCYCYL